MTGTFPMKLDDKKRLIVPSNLRDELGERFFITSGANKNHRCLTIYRESDWAILNENFNALKASQRQGAASFLFSYATACTPDKQFRVMLSDKQMTYAGIERDIVITGVAGKAEIWNQEEFARFEAENLTPEMLTASMEELGL